jgi:serine/threonine protein kinase
MFLSSPHAWCHISTVLLLLFQQAVTDFYDFGKLIGTGAYSEVFLARDQMRSELCAVKVLDRIDREHARLIDRELKVLRLLNSRNLVRTYDIFDTPSQTYVVMEYLAGGELLDMITDNDHLSEPNAKHVLRQVLEAVLYLHNKGIVHRDVKPENILCVSQSFPLRVKLTDFGLSKVVSSGDGKSGDISMRSQCGTAYYLAPEVVNNVSYGKPVDMWACGVVGYVMLAGKFPFYGDSEEKFMRRLRSGVSFPNKEWRSISQNAKLLIRGLLDPNPETRLTAEQALEHRWLNDDSDILTTSSTPSSAVGDARERERLQYAAHNESLSLQLTTFAPSKTRRKYVDGIPDGLAEDDDEDLVLRTEEISHKSSGPAHLSTAQSFDQAGSDDESVLPLPRVRPVHIDPPLATVRVRAAEV